MKILFALRGGTFANNIKGNRVYRFLSFHGHRIIRIIRNYSNMRYYFDRISKTGENGIVLVTHESEFLGSSILTKNIANEMMQSGRTVCILSREFGPLNDTYSSICPIEIFFTKRKYKHILKRLKENGFNRVILSTVFSGDLTKVSKESGFEVISLIHERPVIIESLYRKHATIEMIEYSDNVVLPTNKLKNELAAYLECTLDHKVIIKPQGISFENVDISLHEKMKMQVRKRYGIDSDNNIIIGVGNTTHVKGFDYYVDVAKSNTNYSFLWAGRKDENFYSTIKEFPANFHYIGLISEKKILAELYLSADFLLLTSRTDTFPSAMIEAGFCGCPVIGFEESGGVSEYVDVGINGWLVSEMNSASISNTLKNIKMDIGIRDICHNTAIQYDIKKYADFLSDRLKLF